MGAPCSGSSFRQSIDELRQKLLYTTLELETVKMAAVEENKRNKENVKHLLNLISSAYQERDEARDQLQKLLKKFMPSSSQEFQTILPQPEKKSNTSITESNSLSDTCNHHSHASSPVDSFFDPVSYPDLSNITMADSANFPFMVQPFVQNFDGPDSTTKISSSTTDQATAVIDYLVSGKTLPQKGRLLQAVMGAGPLLQTLLVAGPLPRWRNPPPLQPFKIPPLAIKAPEVLLNSQAMPATASFGQFIQRSLNSSPYADMSCGSSQISTSVLNFNDVSSLLGNNGSLFSSAPIVHSQIPVGKRQRMQ